MFLEKLRAANVARNQEWQNAQAPFTLIFWANELGGEVGEACNILKKLDREFNYKVVGSRAALPALAEELADVVICCDLLAMAAGIDFGSSHSLWCDYRTSLKIHEENGTPQIQDYSLFGSRMLAHAGMVNDICLRYIPRRDQQELMLTLVMLINQAKKTADMIGLDLERGIQTKFNMTSAKCDLKTRLSL